MPPLLHVEMSETMPAAPTHFEITTTGVGKATHIARPTHSRDLIYALYDGGHLDEPPVLGWRWESSDPVDDLVFTTDGVRLVSPRVREIYDARLGPDDEIQWLRGVVTHPDEGDLGYWVPHFPVHYDLLDHDLSSFGPSGLPMQYVFSAAKLAGHAVTAQPRRSLTTILSRAVVDALAAEGVTGGSIMRVAMAP